MKTLVSELVRGSKHRNELRIGYASWDENKTKYSIKYAWHNRNGHVARGGEVPIEVLPQMLEFAKRAIREGYIPKKGQKVFR